MNIIEQPPHGFVELLDHYGSDQRIVAAARISYDGENKGDEQDKKLLFYLYKNRHTSPFEQCNVTFRIKFPVFLMRQFVRHRMFRLNEWSGRYSELADEFFLPTEWRKQDAKNKQGSNVEEDWNEIPYDPAHASDMQATTTKNQDLTELCQEAYERAYKSYQELLSEGVAKEMARFVLPVGIYTKIVVNCDLHNLMHFFRLRLDSHAQKEIRDVAQAMYDLVAPLYPWTFEAFQRFVPSLTDTVLP